jgi:hypothetical protein
MTLTVLDPAVLADVPTVFTVPPTAHVQLAHTGRAYLVTVMVDVILPPEQDRPNDKLDPLCLYSGSQNEPRIPEEVLEAVDAFNADPFGEWNRIALEALDAQAELLLDDRQDLNRKLRVNRALRRRLAAVVD